jgi:hypothetical protein
MVCIAGLTIARAIPTILAGIAAAVIVALDAIDEAVVVVVLPATHNDLGAFIPLGGGYKGHLPVERSFWEVLMGDIYTRIVIEGQQGFRSRDLVRLGVVIIINVE